MTDSKASHWIKGPVFDTLFFSWGWLIVPMAFFILHLNGVGKKMSGFWNLRNPHVLGIIAAVMAFNFIHRNLTHLLVYGDPEIFAERRKSYLIAPAIMASLIAVGILYQPFLYALMFLSTIWNFYHTVMQKIGIVRIYSRKKSFGNPSLEKAFLFSWFVTMVAFLPTQEKTLREAVNSSYYALPVIQHLRPLFLILPYIAMATAGVAAVITVLYFLEEYKNRSGSVAKYIFLASVLGLYGYFLFDFLVAFVAFGFSHSIEYIAFAVIYMRRKYAVPGQRPSLARTVTMNTFSVFLPLLVIVGIVYLGWDQISTESLGFFYVATSFLHYLYDGWIWKVRKPGVGQPLGLAYPSAT